LLYVIGVKHLNIHKRKILEFNTSQKYCFESYSAYIWSLSTAVGSLCIPINVNNTIGKATNSTIDSKMGAKVFFIFVLGKIIGKSGRVIKALRSLLKIKAIKEGKRVYLDLVNKD